MTINQASAIPFRHVDNGVEFCLITSLKRKRWMFPKGIIDPGETYVETALKEAHEEAGLHGRIVGEPLGTYEYFKWETTLEVTVVLMEVLNCDDLWEEAGLRERRWLPAAEALEILSQRELRHLLQKAIEVLDRPSQ
ncbi:MAG: NUDIX hydrolase [Planctomycetes bacterium]|nr:NUDIX hydrolase [Planctomycetota bacterium]MBL7042755.1 NUDIX hydrolase [Pirellulaceae bacterium]